MLRVLHLVGSADSQFYADLSRLYAGDCLTATADPDRYEPHIAYVSPDKTWRFPSGLDGASLSIAPPMNVGDAVSRIVSLGIDVALPQMFCRPGMTTYRALLDLIGLPYVGNAPDVMALGADKARARAVIGAADVRVPHGQVLRSGDHADVTPPAVVKPVDADNSLGVSLVRSTSEYPGALRAAFRHSDRVLVEEYIDLGREVRCGVIERDGTLVGLPLEEYNVNERGKPIRGHDDKIRNADAGLELVAKDSSHAWIVDVDDPATDAVWLAAKRCHEALGCRDYSLFDFRIDPSGRPWFLEASLYNSFAHQSVLTTMAAAAGIGIGEWFAEAVTRTLARATSPSDPSKRSTQ